MKNTIYVYKKNNYGNTLIYPNCNTSELLVKMLGTKTLNSNHINILKQLGYSVEVKGITL